MSGQADSGYAVPMRERLTRDNLHGVWAATATPFDADDRFDEAVFRENIRRLHAAGVHGIYTTDSDGEFYAIEFEEFKRIVTVFADETQRLGVPAQVGVTWCNTQGMLDRLELRRQSRHSRRPCRPPILHAHDAGVVQGILAGRPACGP